MNLHHSISFGSYCVVRWAIPNDMSNNVWMSVKTVLVRKNLAGGCLKTGTSVLATRTKMQLAADNAPNEITNIELVSPSRVRATIATSRRAGASLFVAPRTEVISVPLVSGTPLVALLSNWPEIYTRLAVLRDPDAALIIMAIDPDECLRRGAIGALGSIPGTIAAHPFDLIKMRQQVGGAGVASAVCRIRAGGTRLLAPFYRGVTAGVGQKVLTRGPMFLVSELCTQVVQSRLTPNRDVAVFLGSAASGYITGFCAAPAEWAKVQRGLGGGVAQDVLRAGSSRHSAARLHGAGCRNALFDATFFATEHAARNKAGAPPALSYGCAAALAVVVDFPLDVTVKRWMAMPPAQQLGTLSPLHATWTLLRHRGAATFTGLSAKVCEFAISYAVTGYCSRFLSKPRER